MTKLKDIEDDIKGILPNGSNSGSIAGGSTTISNRTASSSMSGTHGAAGFFNNQVQNPSGYNNNKNNSEFLVFKNITDKQYNNTMTNSL